MMLNTDFEIFFDLQMVPQYNFLGFRSLLRASISPENLKMLLSKEATWPLGKENLALGKGVGWFRLSLFLYVYLELSSPDQLPEEQGAASSHSDQTTRSWPGSGAPQQTTKFLKPTSPGLD